MSVFSVRVMLQSSMSEERRPEIFDMWAINPGEVEYSDSEAGLIYFGTVRLEDYAGVDTREDEGAQSEALFNGIREALRVTAKFLDDRSADVSNAMRAAGMSMRIFMDVHMDEDQMEMELPVELLAACAKHGLGVYVMTNDVSADEVWSAQEEDGVWSAEQF
jgi:hypothetical protein